MTEDFLDGRVRLWHGDSRDLIKRLDDCSVDSVVTDPPYALVSIVKRFGGENAAPPKEYEGGLGAYVRASAGFMGKTWDTGETAFAVEFWAEVMRVLKPGGHVIAASGTRTYHRLAVAIEDAGFEIRDMISWLYGSGFPKSHDVSKGIDKSLGGERAKVKVEASDVRNPTATGAGRDGMEGATRPWIEEALARGYHEKDGDEPATPEAAAWQGWGTALKPACEPWVLARKPLVGTVASNVLTHGTGALNIDGCRVEGESTVRPNGPIGYHGGGAGGAGGSDAGRWPANVIHDGSDEVVGAFPETGAASDQPRNNGEFKSVAKGFDKPHVSYGHADSGGSAARFFYSAKADEVDRFGSRHPTVKPVDLMQYLCRLVTPPGGLVLDPFAGSGTTGEAAWREGFRALLFERESDSVDDIRYRLMHADAGPVQRSHAILKKKGKVEDAGPLFASLEPGE